MLFCYYVVLLSSYFRDPETLEKRFNEIMAIAAECVNPDELKELLATQDNIICYDGFEPSGRMHLAQAVLKAHIVRTLTSNGCHFILWVADWFAKMNRLILVYSFLL